MIYTASGRRVNPFALRVEDVRVEDIAHHLALLNRFTGATRKPIPVAQHSVYVAALVRSRFLKEGRETSEGTPYGRIACQALLHDGAETYFNDVSKWVKGTPQMVSYRTAEKAAQRVVYRAFGLPEEEHPLIEWADRVMVRYEMHRGLPPGCTVGHNCPERENEFAQRSADYPPLTTEEVAAVGPWSFWGWRKARREFLATFRSLTGEGV